MNNVADDGLVRHNDVRGFSLLELIVVMIIVAILAIGVVYMYANPSARVKGQAFTMLGDLNMARSEAVSKNSDVRITFLKGATPADADGYRIWIDEDSDSTYTAGTDTLIREAFFLEEVQFYDTNAANGPDKKPFSPWGTLNMEDGDSDDDGIEFDGSDEFIFTSRGTAEDSGSNTLDKTGYVLLYYPVSAADHTHMRAKPYAVVVTPGTGSISIARWIETGTPWQTK